MCQIINESMERVEGRPTEGSVGDKYALDKDGWIEVERGAVKLRCIHPDGRTDTYFLVKGQTLVADENAEIEIIENYPEEIIAEEPRKEEKPVPIG